MMFEKKGYETIIRELFAMRRHGIRPALEPAKRFLEILGNPQNRFRTFHIAGTNGKGSTTAMIASILKGAGYHTGAYYSPHVSDFRERFLLDGRFFPKREVADTLRWMGGKYESAKGRPEFLTFFEWGTALAFCLFARAGVDAAVLETGMGGNFDATNVVTPEVAVITNVSLEHTAILGRTKMEIAAEKGGIIKTGKPVVCGDPAAAVKNAIRKIAVKRKSEPFFLGADFRISKSGLFTAANGAEFTLLPSMAGDYQRKNAALAAQAVICASHFHVSKDAIENGIAKAVLPGRFEVVATGGREVIFDVAHNPAAIVELAKLLRRKGQKFDFVVGILSDKDYRRMIKTLAPLASRMYCVAPGDERAIPATLLCATAKSFGVSAIALASPADVPLSGKAPLCVTGSFTTVEAVKKLLPK